MTYQKIILLKKEASWAVNLLLLSICLFSSCSSIRSAEGNPIVSGGYDLISYTDLSTSEDSIRFYGTVVDAKTKKRVDQAEVMIVNAKDELVNKTLTNKRGEFSISIKEDSYFGSVIIYKSDNLFIKIVGIDFGSFNNTSKISARLYKYDYSVTEGDFINRADREQLKREIEEMKKEEKRKAKEEKRRKKQKG